MEVIRQPAIGVSLQAILYGVEDTQNAFISSSNYACLKSKREKRKTEKFLSFECNFQCNFFSPWAVKTLCLRIYQ